MKRTIPLSQPIVTIRNSNLARIRGGETQAQMEKRLADARNALKDKWTGG